MIHDSEIVKGCLKGSLKMQKALYDRFASKMLGVCLRYARDTEEAEDMLQEGFIKVFLKLGEFRGEGSFEGWIRRIMVNTAINYYMRFKKHLYQQDLKEIEEITEDQQVVFDHLHVKDLLTLVQNLPVGYRTVFNLYEIEGYQHKEIAEMMDISVSTSKTQLLHARRLLQKRLGSYSREIVKN